MRNIRLRIVFEVHRVRHHGRQCWMQYSGLRVPILTPHPRIRLDSEIDTWRAINLCTYYLFADDIIMNNSNSSLGGIVLLISWLTTRQQLIQVGVFIKSVHDQSLSYLWQETKIENRSSEWLDIQWIEWWLLQLRPYECMFMRVHTLFWRIPNERACRIVPLQGT